MQPPSSDQESSDDEDDYQGTLYTDDSASDNDDDQDDSDDDHQIVLPLPLLPIFPAATTITQLPIPTPNPIPIPIPQVDHLAVITGSVRAQLARGETIGPIMQILAQCVGEHLGIPLAIDDMLALYGVYPRINERFEYIMARGIAIKLGIAPPASFRAMKDSSESLRRALQKASDDSVTKNDFASQKGVLYPALTALRRVYKPLTGKGLDLVSVDFTVDTVSGIGKLMIHLYEMKDHKEMFPKDIRAVAIKLIAECQVLRKLIEHTYTALVAGTILQDTEYKCTLVINGRVGQGVGAEIVDENGQRCALLHGVQVHELMLQSEQARHRYRRQIRRAADDHA